jgi:hypothetical protein
MKRITVCDKHDNNGPFVNVKKTRFPLSFPEGPNKLKCLSMTSFFQAYSDIILRDKERADRGGHCKGLN